MLDEERLAFVFNRHHALSLAQQEVTRTQRLRICIANALNTLPKLKCVKLYGKWSDARGMSFPHSKQPSASLDGLGVTSGNTKLIQDPSSPIYLYFTVVGYLMDKFEPLCEVLIALRITKASIRKLEFQGYGLPSEPRISLTIITTFGHSFACLTFLPRPISASLDSLIVLDLEAGDDSLPIVDDFNNWGKKMSGDPPRAGSGVVTVLRTSKNLES